MVVSTSERAVLTQFTDLDSRGVVTDIFVSINLRNPSRDISCTCDTGKIWCAHKLKAINENLDGPFIFGGLDPMSGQCHLEIPMAPNFGIDISVIIDAPVTLGIPDKKLVCDILIKDVNVALKSNLSVNNKGKVGELHYGEGRGVIRSILLGRFDKAFYTSNIIPESGVVCKSKRHSMIEQAAWEQIVTKGPEAVWAWKYVTFAKDGVCPPCASRMDDLSASLSKIGNGLNG